MEQATGLVTGPSAKSQIPQSICGESAFPGRRQQVRKPTQGKSRPSQVPLHFNHKYAVLLHQGKMLLIKVNEVEVTIEKAPAG